MRRDGLVEYENHLGENGRWTHPAAALASLDRGQSRPLTEDEHAEFLADVQDVEYVKQDAAGQAKASFAALKNSSGESSSPSTLKIWNCEEWVARRFQ